MQPRETSDMRGARSIETFVKAMAKRATDPAFRYGPRDISYASRENQDDEDDQDDADDADAAVTVAVTITTESATEATEQEDDEDDDEDESERHAFSPRSGRPRWRPIIYLSYRMPHHLRRRWLTESSEKEVADRWPMQGRSGFCLPDTRDARAVEHH